MNKNRQLDAAEGYVEDGREIFDDDLDEESIRKNQKTKKRDRTANHKNVEPPKGNLEKMFKNMPAKRKREVRKRSSMLTVRFRIAFGFAN